PLSARFDLANDDRQVRKGLDNAARATARARMETLHDQRLADVRLGNDQVVDVEVVVVLGIGDRRLQAFLDIARDALARKLRVGENSPNLCPAISSDTDAGICCWPL